VPGAPPSLIRSFENVRVTTGTRDSTYLSKEREQEVGRELSKLREGRARLAFHLPCSSSRCLGSSLKK
jgi:hypothetical protein